MTPPVALTIAGSDSSAGAGIQADVKTFAALGVYAATAVTAVTAQSSSEVRLVFALPAAVVAAQVEAVLDDLPVRAVKTGMLATAEVVELVADLAAAGRLPNLVVDPVMAASVGTRLLDEDAEHLYRTRLLPAATVFTPNRQEAEVLLGHPLPTLDEVRRAAIELAGLTRGVVVVTGGDTTADGDGRVTDVVACGDRAVLLTAPRVDTANTHGTGCTFASAVAAGLARGSEPIAAVRAAQQFVHRALAGAATWEFASGHGPLDHFHWEEQ